MTDEHVPPKSTGNDAPVGRLVAPFDIRSAVEQVAEWDEGMVVRTLCMSEDGHLGCNERASNWRYVAEYRRWHDRVIEQARRAADSTGVDPLRGPDPFTAVLDLGAANPARFVRQVIGMFLAVQESPDLFARYTSLHTVIGSEPGDQSRPRRAGLSIEPLHLYLSVCNARWGYLSVPAARISIDLALQTTSLWIPPCSARADQEDTLLLVLAPFALILSTSSSTDLGLDISAWSTWDVDRRPSRHQRTVTIPTADTIDPVMRAMIYPDQYVDRSPDASPLGSRTP